MIVGNDISKFQGDVDFNVYKNNTNFLIIKATEGNGYTDSKFARNQSECRRVGLPLGFYHFARPDLNNTPEAEADWFLKVVGDLKEGELLALDYECANQKQSDVDWCKKWLDRVQEKTQVKALIYLNQSQIKSFNWQVVVDAGYGLWLASYQPDGVGDAGEWPFMAMQQTSSSQQVPGIVGNVDRDVFFGDVATLKKYGYHAPTPQPQPQPQPTPTPAPVYSVTVEVKGATLSVSGQQGTIETTLGLTGKKDNDVIYNQEQKIKSTVQLPAAPENPDTQTLAKIKTIIVGKGWPWQKTASIKKLLGL